MLTKTEDDNWDSVRETMAIISRKIFQKLGNRVLTGPFKEMIVTDQPNWDDGNATLKLLGCYEHELWDAIELVINRKPTAAINVGCAEGYYAIGLARRMPDIDVVAFDIDTYSLGQCAEMARQNGVQLKTRAGCWEAEDLWLGYSNALYVLDCEAYEETLLDPFRCHDLYSADIIVECHDWVGPISYTLAKRFEPTHDVDVIEPQLPNYPTYEKMLAPLPIGIRLSAVVEKRPQNTLWLAMMSKQR